MKVLDKGIRIAPRCVGQLRSPNAAGAPVSGETCVAISTDNTHPRKDAP